jgi:hypothetical protein
MTILTHSADFKSAKIYLLPYFQPFWAKNMPNWLEKSIQNS